MKKLVLCTFILFFLFCGTNALADTFGFNDIDETYNDTDFIKNFIVAVDYDEEANKIIFTFTNENDDNSFISSVYLDFGLTESPLITAGAYIDADSNGQVNFSDSNFQELSQDINENLGVPFTADYSASSNNPVQGINFGETGVFTFDLVAGNDFENVIAALNSGDLRIAIDVRDNRRDSTEGYLASTSNTPVPEPATMLLLGAGLLGIAGMGRKKLFRKK